MEELIIDDLLNEIIAGKYEADEALPSEPTLSHRYGVPRIVVRRAYYQLEERGYVRSVKGKGRFRSRQRKLVLLPIGDGRGFSEKLQSADVQLVTHNLGVERVERRTQISSRFGAEAADHLYALSLLRVIDGEPAALHTTYVDDRKFPSIEADGGFVHSVFAYFERNGASRFESRDVTLSAALPTLEEQRVLLCGALVPIMLSQYEIHTLDGILAYIKSIYRGDRFKYRMFTDGTD